MDLTWDQVRAWRLSHHHLHQRAPGGKLLDVVGDMCGLHAQVQSSAEVQAWARVEGISPEDLRRALWEERSLVRTWAMRGTLHVLRAQDLPLFVAALHQHDRWWKGAWLRMIGFSAEELRAILDAIHNSLGVRPITREQLADKVAERVGGRSGANAVRLGRDAQAGRVRGVPDLRPAPGPERDVRPDDSVARRVDGAGDREGLVGDHPAVPTGLRPGLT